MPPHGHPSPQTPTRRRNPAVDLPPTRDRDDVVARSSERLPQKTAQPTIQPGAARSLSVEFNRKGGYDLAHRNSQTFTRDLLLNLGATNLVQESLRAVENGFGEKTNLFIEVEKD